MRGFSIATVMVFFTTFDHFVADSQLSPLGEYRIVPDPATLKILPYAKKEPLFFCDIKTQELTDSFLCSRTILKKLVENSDYEAYASFGTEFYFLVKESGEWNTADHSLCYTTKGMDIMNEVNLDIIEALESPKRYSR